MALSGFSHVLWDRGMLVSAVEVSWGACGALCDGLQWVHAVKEFGCSGFAGECWAIWGVQDAL